MNEPRYRLILNISGKPDNEKLEENWQTLIQRFTALEYRVMPFYRKDILEKIRKQQKVLSSQDPTKKLYRTIMKKLSEIQEEIDNLGARAR